MTHKKVFQSLILSLNSKVTVDQKIEAEIVARVLKGDRQAYAMLVEEYKSPVYNLAYRMTGNSSDADDLTQETFIRAYKYLWRYDSKRKFFTWLYSISLNLIKNHIKKNKIISKGVDGIRILSAEQSNSLQDRQFIENHDINVYLLQVPYKLRSLIIMKYHQELSFEEIAQITGKSLSAVKMSIYRGLESLKKMIKD
jgi:RNA polymerase sigma-70 factor (ECF subfamily)